MGQSSLSPRKKYGKVLYCIAFPVRGRTRCRSHGGATPQGVASPHYRGKGYSQAVPKYLKDIYEARFNDPDLLSLHKEIALCDTRIEDLLTQISGRMGDCIDQVTACFLAFQMAYEADQLEGEVPSANSTLWATPTNRALLAFSSRISVQVERSSFR